MLRGVASAQSRRWFGAEIGGRAGHRCIDMLDPVPKGQSLGQLGGRLGRAIWAGQLRHNLPGGFRSGRLKMTRFDSQHDDSSLPGDVGGIALAPGVVVPPGAVEISYSSSSGPGGQNVNKRATKCTLRVPLHAIPLTSRQAERFVSRASAWVTASGDVLIQADENRSQERNREACFERLRELLIGALKEPKIRRKTKPSRGSKERRLTEKKIRGETKRRRGESE